MSSKSKGRRYGIMTESKFVETRTSDFTKMSRQAVVSWAANHLNNAKRFHRSISPKGVVAYAKQKGWLK